MANNRHSVANLRTPEERDVRYGLFYKGVDDYEGIWQYLASYAFIFDAVGSMEENIDEDDIDGNQYLYKIEEMPVEDFK